MVNELNKNSTPTSGQSITRKARLFSRGGRHFAIAEDDIAVIGDWSVPTPLPNAPPTVMGVVSVQGRILTMLDLSVMCDRNFGRQDRQVDNGAAEILALRGDEQLALAADNIGDIVDITQTAGVADGLILGVFQHQDNEVNILNVKQLFSSAIQGRERRRRRF